MTKQNAAPEEVYEDDDPENPNYVMERGPGIVGTFFSLLGKIILCVIKLAIPLALLFSFCSTTYFHNFVNGLCKTVWLCK